MPNTAVNLFQYSFEYSSSNAWNWNYNNQNWNNNNKNNTNKRGFAVRTCEGEIMDEKVSVDDIYFAYECCRKRKKNKLGSKKFETYALYNCIQIAEDINNRKYKLRPAECFLIFYPTIREVFCANFRDRVVQHFVYNELNPIIEKELIYDTASCRVAKGTDFAIKRVSRFVRRETNNYQNEAYYLKADLSGFFMSMDRQRVKDNVYKLIDEKYKGKFPETLKYLVNIIALNDVTHDTICLCPKSKWDYLPARKSLFGNDHGMPIGNICSQLFANLYLSELDHKIKARHKSYERFVDDFVVIDHDRQKLLETKEMIENYLPTINGKLNKKKTTINQVKYGIRFLGVVIRPYYNLLAKSRINRLYFTTEKIKDPEQMYMSVSSRRGMFVRYHGKRIAWRWYFHIPESIREVLKMNYQYKFRLIGERKC